MRLLSLDASSTSIGYVAWDDATPVAWGTIRLNKGKAAKDIGLRLIIVAVQFELMLDRYAPDQVAVEGAAFHAQPMALLAQAEVRGVLRQRARNAGLVLIDVPPTVAKKALTGTGNADKAQMAASARRYLVGLFDEHAADACGVGLGAMAILRGEVVKKPAKKRKKAA